MSSLLDIEEEEGKTSEITLSTASLLGIFFGLVLVCGVFFGFGYSMGRGAQPGAQASAPSTTPAADSTEPDETTMAEDSRPAALTPLEQQEGTQAPATAAPSSAVAQPKPDDVAPDTARADVPAAATPDPSDHANAAPAVAGKPGAAHEAAVAATAAPYTAVATSAPGLPMVQIAAVARQEDAQVLLSALRQRGYRVVVRSEPQDKLLHVQVGPFADRMEATAIKQKLLSDGYNAIIKQ